MEGFKRSPKTIPKSKDCVYCLANRKSCICSKCVTCEKKRENNCKSCASPSCPRCTKIIFYDDGECEEICATCLPEYWPKQFEEIELKDATELCKKMQKEFNFLYNPFLIDEYLQKGKEILNHLEKTDEISILPTKNKFNVASVIWRILFLVSKKDSLHLSGSILIEDTDYKIFKYLSGSSYKREFKTLKKIVTKVSSSNYLYFGSTHFGHLVSKCTNIESLQKHLPHHYSKFVLESKETVNGYEQLGIFNFILFLVLHFFFFSILIKFLFLHLFKIFIARY